MERFEIIYPYCGLSAGLVVALLAVGGAIYLGSIGAITVAGLLVGVPVVGCIGWFVNSRVSQVVKQPQPAVPKPPRKKGR